MSTREERQQHAIERGLEARGIHGVHVTVDETDTAFLDGEVGSQEEEVAAVEIAIAAQVEAVIDGIHHPGQDAHHGHIGDRHTHLPLDQEPDKHADDTPELKILHGAHLGDRVFDTEICAPVRTGNPID